MSSQIIANIIYSSSIYLMIAISFHTIYVVSKFFHFSHAINITFGAYFSWFILNEFNASLFLSSILSICLSILIALLLELTLYKPLRKRQSNAFVLLIASLGIYIVLQNLISIIWGDNIKSFQSQSVNEVYSIFGASVSKIQSITFVICVITYISIHIFINKTRYGRQIRAVSSNENLLTIFGIESNAIILLSFVIGSGLAALAGILVALDTDMTPTMGFNLLLYGIVAMIIGGVGKNSGLVGGALLLATAQNLGAYYISSQWMDAIAYIILILFLIWKPLGFSGKQLKKIEI